MAQVRVRYFQDGPGGGKGSEVDCVSGFDFDYSDSKGSAGLQGYSCFGGSRDVAGY